MRIFYITMQDFKNDTHIGVNKKIVAQVDELRKNGAYVEYCGYETNELVIYGDGFKKDIYVAKNKLDKRFSVNRYLIKYIINNKFDCIYIRYYKCDPSVLFMLKRLKSYAKCIFIEIPTYPYDLEVKNVKSISFKLLNYIDRICRFRLKKYVDYIVTFSDYKMIFGIETIKINNGIDLQKNKLVNR